MAISHAAGYWQPMPEAVLHMMPPKPSSQPVHLTGANADSFSSSMRLVRAALISGYSADSSVCSFGSPRTCGYGSQTAAQVGIAKLHCSRLTSYRQPSLQSVKHSAVGQEGETAPPTEEKQHVSVVAFG